MSSLVHSDWNARIWIEGAGDAERRINITPEIAGWNLLSFRTYTFRAGQVIDGESATDEMSMVLLSGSVTIEVSGPGESQTWECRGRPGVFDGAPFAIYLPPGWTYRTTVHSDADCAYGRAPAEGARPPRLIRPEETVEERDGVGNRVRRIFGPNVAERLLCREMVIEPGASAFSTSALPGDVGLPKGLEEVLYYRAAPMDGWGMQHLQTPDGERDETLTIRHGDAVIVRGEQHPLAASPGARLYALNYAAGPSS